jgi:ATP-independent RNA helicase DbpA
LDISKVTTKDFSNLALRPELMSAVEDLGFKEMTPIQERGLPPVLEGLDIIAQAATGSGKTAVFGLGILSQISLRNQSIQALVLCPTRELANQVTKDIKTLARFLTNFKIMSLCGGKPVRTQVATLDQGVHVVVGTPGRIMDHLTRGTLNTKYLQVLVLDEADRMLDMGFSEVMRNIVERIPKERQTLLFSATYPDHIKALSRDFQKHPVEVRIKSLHSSEKISQTFFKVNNESHRLNVLKSMLGHYKPKTAVIFCNTRLQCQDVVEELQKASHKALAIHGDLEQREREEVLLLFSNGSLSVLVATDVASRGLDIKDLDTVVNYELPRDPEVYIHRIGRTGRAGKHGQALSFFTMQETRRVEAIEAYQKTPVVMGNLEELVRKTSSSHESTSPSMKTLQVEGGKRNKICKGDILGALTGGQSPLTGSDIGKIDVFEAYSCVAIQNHLAAKALKILEEGKIKGRNFKVKQLY